MSRELPRAWTCPGTGRSSSRLCCSLEAARRSGAVLSVAPSWALCRDGSCPFPLVTQLLLQLPSRCLCAWAGLRAPTAIPHHQPLPPSPLPASTALVSPWQAAAAAPGVASLGWKTKGNGVGTPGPHRCPDLQRAQQALATHWILEDLKDAGEARDAGIFLTGFRAQQMVPHALCPSSPSHSKQKGCSCCWRGGGRGRIIIFSAFFQYGKAMPTDGAVQSRDRSLWQSTGEAAAEHGILIIKHNER